MPSSILAKLMSDLKAQNTQGKQCRIGFTSDKENNRSKRHDPRARVKRGWRVRARARIDIVCC